MCKSCWKFCVYLYISRTEEPGDECDSIPQGVLSMTDEEKEEMVHEEDEHGNVLVYPVWSKKNAPKDNQSKWEVPVYL